MYKLIRKTSGLKLIAAGILVLIGVVTGIKEATIIRRSEQGIFRFEDYETAEEAKTALLQLHPVGSKINMLKQTLENAGSRCVFRSKDKVLNEIEQKGDYMVCVYEKPLLILFSTEWRAIIDVTFPLKDEVGTIKIYKFFNAI